MIPAASRSTRSCFSRLRRPVTVIKALDISVEQTLEVKRKLTLPGHKQVVVVGGGQAGCTVLGRLLVGGGFEPKQALLIDKQAHRFVREGLDLFAHDMLELEDVRRSILSQIDVNAQMMFEEVIHFDPDHNFIGTCDGSDVTFDYCVLAPSLSPDLGQVRFLSEALADKFTPVLASFDLDSAAKMQATLASFRGSRLAVYCAGEQGLNLTSPLNHSFILKSRFPAAEVTLLVQGEKLSSDTRINEAVELLTKEKGIHIRYNHTLVSIDGSNSATLSAKHLTHKLDFDLLVVDPPRSEPKWLTDCGIYRKDFDPRSFQHRHYPALFAQGSYAQDNNSLAGILEQSHTCTVNLALQMLFDQDVRLLESNRQVLDKGYQRHRLFPTHALTLDLEAGLHEGLFRAHRPSKARFYWFALNRYNSFFKRTAKGKDFGRLGYFMPSITSKKLDVQPLKRRLSFAA